MEETKIPTMLKIRAAAEKTHLPYYHILKLCKEGTLPHIRAGKVYYVNLEKLVEYLNSQGTGEQG